MVEGLAYYQEQCISDLYVYGWFSDVKDVLLRIEDHLVALTIIIRYQS